MSAIDILSLLASFPTKATLRRESLQPLREWFHNFHGRLRGVAAGNRDVLAEALSLLRSVYEDENMRATLRDIALNTAARMHDMFEGPKLRDLEYDIVRRMLSRRWTSARDSYATFHVFHLAWTPQMANRMLLEEHNRQREAEAS